MIHRSRWAALLLFGALGACAGEVAEEAYDGDSPPPPAGVGLEGAATSGPSVVPQPDTAMVAPR